MREIDRIAAVADSALPDRPSNAESGWLRKVYDTAIVDFYAMVGKHGMSELHQFRRSLNDLEFKGKPLSADVKAMVVVRLAALEVVEIRWALTRKSGRPDAPKPAPDVVQGLLTPEAKLRMEWLVDILQTTRSIFTVKGIWEGGTAEHEGILLNPDPPSEWMSLQRQIIRTLGHRGQAGITRPMTPETFLSDVQRALGRVAED